MKKIINILVVIICLINSYELYSQFSADVDGKLDVSPVNGSLKYSYPISNNSIDGFPIKVDLNYSTNVPCTYFLGYDKINDIDSWIKLTNTVPLWIIGVNGFAIDVVIPNNRMFMNFKKLKGRCPHYETKADPPPSHNVKTFNDTCSSCFEASAFSWDNLDYDKTNETYVPLMVEGYDYCNRMEQMTSNCSQDFIRILKSDGSILELRNKKMRQEVNDDQDTTLYTGYYYENSINPEGYAIVEYDNKYMTSYLQDFNNNKLKPRVLRYYRGDGLEYVFREIVIPYGKRLSETNNNFLADDHCSGIPSEALPTIFYLEEINSDSRRLVDFNRDWHNFSESVKKVNRGRSYITEFANHFSLLVIKN